jgi:hypothetical protein
MIYLFIGTPLLLHFKMPLFLLPVFAKRLEKDPDIENIINFFHNTLLKGAERFVIQIRYRY